MRGYLPELTLEAPGTLDGVLDHLADGFRPLAGGTDIMVVLAAGSLPPGRYVSIWELDELRGIDVRDDVIELGALTTYTDVREHPVLQAEYPMLVEAARLSGAVAIQNRGTLGGNIVNASPAADSPPALLAYDAEIELVSKTGARWVPYAGFHTGYKTMVKRDDELLRAIRMPRRPPGRHYYRKVGTRKAQAITKIGIAVLIDAKDTVEHIRIALASVGPTVLRAEQTEAALHGKPLTPEVIDAALAAFEQELTPIDDVRSTEHYRRTVAKNLLRDALHD